MGLLDLMNRPGVRQGLGLLAAAGPSPVPMSFGQRAMGLLGQMDAEKRAEEERQAQAQMRALQQQLLQAQLGERQDMAADRRTQRDQAALDQQLLRQRFTPMDGPMPDGGPLMPRVDPADFIAQGGSLGGVQNLMALNAALQPPPRKRNTAVVDGNLLEIPDQGPAIPLFSAPTKPSNQTELTRLIAERDSLPPNDPNRRLYDQKLGLMTSRAAPVQVNVGDSRFESEFSKQSGKSMAEMYGTINNASFKAPQTIRTLERMEALLQGVDGGKLSPLGLEVASAANSIGIKLDPKLGNKQAAESLAREMAATFRQPGTGPMTDKDFDNFLQIVPNLAKSAEGRRQITATMKRAAARDIQLGNMARNYVKQRGVMDEGFLDIAAQFMAENPVVQVPNGWQVER
jgi:hypothetical protein